ncbi:MAG: DUF3048 domain-containing protein, partial [Chloroflexi bacterium]|nr:DUF3048 domain-containing protein [Chloroflexota bacterium]
LALAACLLIGAVGLAAQTDVIGPNSYPDGINPLTGLSVDNPDDLDRRPLVIKISNYPPEIRPQAGLNSAEVVWEHLLAGGVTRFAAVFLATDLDHVGPIRSARLIDFELTRIYDALFVYSGMAQGTLDRLRADGVVSSRIVGGAGPCPALCRFPREGLALEHTLFGDMNALRDLAVEMGRDVVPETVSGMAFSESIPSDGIGLDSIRISYRRTTVEWVHDPESGRWLRNQDGAPHFAAETDTQINAANVLILEADHVEQPFTRDGYWGPPNYAFTVELTGSGRIFLLRDGQYIEGEWRRDSPDAPLLFFDTVGNVLPFKPGNTFVNVVPRWQNGYELTFVLAAPLTATITTPGGVNLRLGPAQAYASPDVAYPGDEFRAVGRDRNGSWVQLLRPNGEVLWAAAETLVLDGDVFSLPFSRSTFE